LEPAIQEARQPIQMAGTKYQIRSETASRYFFVILLFNLVVGAIVTSLVLIPPLALPIKLTVWPGSWMFIAYFSYMIAGVLGSLTWTMIYYLLPRLLNIGQVDKRVTMIQIVLTQIGIYGTVILMGLVPGYTGGTFAIYGFGTFLITRVIEWAVIPTGIFVGLAVFGTITGVANIVLSMRPPSVA
jgi:hypothetical protein